MSKHAATGGAPWGRGRSGLAMLAVALLGLALVASLLVSAPSANSAEGDPTTTASDTATGTASPSASGTGTATPSPSATGGEAGVPNTVWAASPPVLIDPERNATLNPRLDLVFTWSVVPGATSYEMQIALSDKFTAPTLVFPEGSVTTTSSRYALVSELAPGEYWWRVRGLSDRGRTGWSKQIPFQVSEDSPAVPNPISKPEYPVLRAPFPPVASAPPQPINRTVLSWAGVLGASEYQLEFARVLPGDQPEIVLTCDTPHTSMTPTGIYRIDFKGSTQGDPCNIYGYVGDNTIPSAPAAPGATPGPASALVTWSPPEVGTPISFYNVQYSINGGAWTTAAESPTSATSLVVTGLTNGSPVVFRVQAVNSIGAGPWSDPGPDGDPPGVIPLATLAPLSTEPATCSRGEPIGPFKPGETVYFRVRAVDSRVLEYTDGLTQAFDPCPPLTTPSIVSPWSDWHAFVAAPPLLAGTGPLAPSFEAESKDNPLLQWWPQPLSPTGAIPNYRVAVATDRRFVNTIAKVQTGNTRLVMPGVLVDDNSLSYYWCVLPERAPSNYDAQDYCGVNKAPQGVVWSAFRKRGDPVTVRKTQKQAQRDNVTFEWNEYPPANGGTSNYCLQVTANYAEFEDNGDCETGGSVESFVTDNYTYVVTDDALYSPGLYYWRVAAVDSGGLILPWSEVQYIRVTASPPPNPRVPSIVGTRGGFKVTWSGPTRLPDGQYVWTNDGGPHITGFRISWKRSSKGTWKRQSVSPNVSSLRMTGLPSGVTLRVVVQAENDKGFSVGPNVFTVRTR